MKVTTRKDIFLVHLLSGSYVGSDPFTERSGADTIYSARAARRSIPHTAYAASPAPPLAALPAAGIVMFWRAFRADGWRAWLLPAAANATAGAGTLYACAPSS